MEKITKAMIRDGIWQKKIRFVTDPAGMTDYGPAVVFGYCWLPFIPARESGLDLMGYLAAADMDEVVSYIHGALERERGDDEDLYSRCAEYLEKSLREYPQYGFTVNTPMGTLAARPSGDSEYPGVWVLTDRPGEPGMLLEYDAVNRTLAARVWDCTDPENDPQVRLDILTGRPLY